MRVVWAILIAFLLCAIFVAGCFESSTHVPPAPALGKDVSSCAGQHETFVQSGDMTGESAYQTASLLKDGKVLFAGGYLSSGIVQAAALITSEVYDPAGRSFHETGHLTVFRADDSAVRLPDGRVLVTGGYDQGRYLTSIGRVALKSAEIFDPGSE